MEVRGAATPPSHRPPPRGHPQLPPVGAPADRRDDEIFMGLGGDLGKMVERIWNDERRALRQGGRAGRLDHDFYE